MKRPLVIATFGAATAALLAIAVPATAATGTASRPHGATPPNLSVPWSQADDATDPGCTSSCTSSPPSGPGPSMAYDAATHQLVLFGIDVGNATWTWNGSTWSQVDDSTDPGCVRTCVDSPPTRTTAGMAYDPDAGAIILFGGNDLNDTWAWNGTAWTQVADAGDPGCTSTCTDSPPASAGAQMAYDPLTHDIVLFGGNNYSTNFNDTWTLRDASGTYVWTQVDDSTDPGCLATCTSSPPTRNVASLTWDPATDQLVLFGGEMTSGDANGLSDTWLWNGTSWQQTDDHHGALAGCGESLPVSDRCPSSPNGRVGMAVAYDPTIGRLVLFGGMNHYADPEYDDTWVWNGRAWLQVDDTSDPHCTSTCAGAPPARDAFAIADDPATHQLVLFGGYDLEDTWVAPATPSAPPAPVHLRFQRTATGVIVRWAMPLVAGPPILRFEVVARPGGDSCTSTTAHHCTLAGLGQGSFLVSVRATNFVGTGPAATKRLSI